MEGGRRKGIGAVPEGWEAVRLGDAIEELKNGFASGKRDENGIVQIRMNNVTTDGRLIFDSYLKVPVPGNLNYWLLKKGDLLFNNTNSIDLVGKSAIFNDAPFPCTFSNHFTRLRFKKELVLPELILYHFLILWEKSYFKSVAIRHVGQSAVHTNYLLKLHIPLPPLPEQRRIAEVLGTVDSAIQKVGGAIAGTERLKRGLMQRLLTKGIGHERFKETEVGRVPEEWEVVSIGDICKVVTGGTPSTMHPEYFGGTIKWLKSGDIKELYIYDTEEKITQLGIENSNAKIHPPGTVAIALSGRGQTRGKTAIIKRPMACSQSVAIMIPNSELVAEYLHYNLSNRYLEIRNLTGHYDRSGLNLAIVSNVNIPLPPLPEQRRIAEILSAVDRKLELERRRKEKLERVERVKKGLMNELLTGRKRIKVGS